MATTLIGPIKWSGSRDAEGQRTYKILWKIRGLKTDGPAAVLRTPGIFYNGAPWAYDGDYDLWAWCRPDATITPLVTDEPNTHWTLEQTFSSVRQKRCNETDITDPLLEPQKVSGTFVKYTEEATVDRFGSPIETSAHEPLRGAQVEFDKNRPSVTIEQNVFDLQLPLCTQTVDTVNDAPLWGLPKRCVKLSQFSWERKYQGQCEKYYTRTFVFDVRYETFDRDLVDAGTMVKRGKWDKDPTSLTYRNYVVDPLIGSTGAIYPSDYVQFKDWNDENATVVLDGHGRPWDFNSSTTGTGDDTVGTIHVEKYDESNFLLLNVPTDF